MNSKSDDLREYSIGGINISVPDDPSGGYKVANLDNNKKFNVTGRTDNAAKSITLVKCRDITVPAAPLAESTGTPTGGGANFHFTGNEVVSEYGVRRFKVTCEYNNNPADTDYDNQDFAAVPSKLKVTYTGVTDNTCASATCGNANAGYFPLAWGTGPADVPWKWGYQIPSAADYICDCPCVVAVLTTADEVGCLTVSIKPNFEAVTSISRYQKADWDFRFPGGIITLNRLSPAGGVNQCNWPATITVAPDPV